MAAAKPLFEKHSVLVTPKARAVYPWLSDPDTKFDDDGVYRTKLAFDPEDDQFKAFKKKIEAIHKEALAACKDAGLKKVEAVNPFAPEEDSEGEETGSIVITAKSKAKQKMKNGDVVDITLNIVDAKKQKLPRSKKVYGGSILRLAVRPVPYYMANGKKCGITFYISGVQVIELQTGGGGDFFDVEEGFEYEADEADPFEAEDSADDDESGGDDDLY